MSSYNILIITPEFPLSSNISNNSSVSLPGEIMKYSKKIYFSAFFKLSNISSSFSLASLKNVNLEQFDTGANVVLPTTLAAL